MTTFIIIASALMVVFTLISLALLTKFLYNRFKIVDENEDDKFNVKLTWHSVYLLIIAFMLIAISFVVPFILTRNSITADLDFSNTGPIGDTIGGLMNPFIALAGVLVTGLAFYMQYKANLLQRKIFYKQLEEDKERFKTELATNKEQFDKQFKSQENQVKLQQFEAQFYEMLRLHKENVNEIEMFAKRRKIIGNSQEDEHYEFEDYLITKRNSFVELKKEFEFILFKAKKRFGSITPELYITCYEIFFWGLKGFDNDDASLIERIVLEYSDDIQGDLAKMKDKQYNPEISLFEDLVNFDTLAFSGHSEFLGHYYRHLFHTVKFVVSAKDVLLTYDECRNYLRVLRAQLSNHEQIMMFYNWLSTYGGAWENNENKFFTEYGMIHNLWHQELFNDVFISEKVKQLKNTPVSLRKSDMFELPYM